MAKAYRLVPANQVWSAGNQPKPLSTRATRLSLCDLTGRVLKQGLEVLGIETLEQM